MDDPLAEIARLRAENAEVHDLLEQSNTLLHEKVKCMANAMNAANEINDHFCGQHALLDDVDTIMSILKKWDVI